MPARATNKRGKRTRGVPGTWGTWCAGGMPPRAPGPRKISRRRLDSSAPRWEAFARCALAQMGDGPGSPLARGPAGTGSYWRISGWSWNGGAAGCASSAARLEGPMGAAMVGQPISGAGHVPPCTCRRPGYVRVPGGRVYLPARADEVHGGVLAARPVSPALPTSSPGERGRGGDERMTATAAKPGATRERRDVGSLGAWAWAGARGGLVACAWWPGMLLGGPAGGRAGELRLASSPSSFSIGPGGAWVGRQQLSLGWKTGVCSWPALPGS